MSFEYFPDHVILVINELLHVFRSSHKLCYIEVVTIHADFQKWVPQVSILLMDTSLTYWFEIIIAWLFVNILKSWHVEYNWKFTQEGILSLITETIQLFREFTCFQLLSYILEKFHFWSKYREYRMTMIDTCQSIVISSETFSLFETSCNLS